VLTDVEVGGAVQTKQRKPDVEARGFPASWDSTGGLQLQWQRRRRFLCQLLLLLFPLLLLLRCATVWTGDGIPRGS
jgi:hypothetical protein